jgi:hypothetical protein
MATDDECLWYAHEYARLAGLTKHQNVRDELLDLRAAGRPLRSTSAALMRACSVLRQPPLHQKRNDQDNNRAHENVSASTRVTIRTATRTALRDWVQAPSTHGHFSLPVQPFINQSPRNVASVSTETWSNRGDNLMTAALGRDQRPTICHAQDRYVGWSGRRRLAAIRPAN